MIMIRLIDARGNPFWVDPECLSAILYSEPFERVELYYHIASSCMSVTMDGSVDDVKQMIDEAIAVKFK